MDIPVKRIGLLYSYNENWIGGSYYIQNLVNSFHTVEQTKKPELFVFTNSAEEYQTIVDATHYPYMTRATLPRYSLFERAINKALMMIAGRWLIKKKIDVDILFPVADDVLLRSGQKCLFWIPDLQEHYLPGFFSREEIAFRKSWQSNLIKRKEKLLFSSNSARENYMSLYPRALTKNYVVPFAVTHPEYKSIDIDSLKKKYGITGNYFISPNQFWAHKNHQVIVDSVARLKNDGRNITMVFTGKENDHRNPAYVGELKKSVSDLHLEKSILFLGFIPRREQLKLMSCALAVVQPSRFEGWSTVVEDIKAMDQYAIASGIRVHKEQICENVSFFDPDDSQELAVIIKNISEARPIIIKKDYDQSVKAFAVNFLNVVN